MRWVLLRLPLCGDRCPSLGECRGELGEHGQIGMEPNTVHPTNTEGQQRPLVLQPTELPLDRPALVVQRLEPLGRPGHQRVQPVDLDPDFTAHSPVGQRHLDVPRLASDPANVQDPCSHDRGRCLPCFTAVV